MKMDWKMFPMKLHYFLRFMGTGPLTVFLPVITRQKGVPATVVGGIWTVLPFVSLVTKISAGATADYFRAHRAVFLSGVTLMMVSLTALYWTPDLPPPCHPLPSPITQEPPMGDDGGGGLRTKLINETDFGQGISINSSDTTLPCLQYFDSNSDGINVWVVLGRYEFWLLFVCLFGQYCGHTTGITMQETVCFQMLGDSRHKYGAQRVWGTVGIGISAIVSGALVDWYTKATGKQDYLPAHILTAVFLAVDLVVVARLKFPVPQRRTGARVSQGAHWWLRVLLVLVSTGVVGVACGLLWTFEFILVEDVAKTWQPQFPHLKLLLGLLMGVQAFLAEVPFFLLAGRIIEKLGHIRTFFVSLVAFSLRICVYAAITNPWMFIPAELLHGVSFAIIYPCFTSYASTVSPKGAEATTQAIFGATFFACTGVGGLLGGWLFQSLGGKSTFLIVGAAIGVYALMFVGAHALITYCRPRQKATDTGKKAECEGLKEKRKDGEEEEEEEELKKQKESLITEDGVS